MTTETQPFDLFVHHTSEVVTAAGSLGSGCEQALAPIPNGVVGVVGETVAFVGPASEVPTGALTPATRIVDAEGGFVGPGFIDPHTHLVFAGERSKEFELRAKGASYLEIAKAGGGIMSTVKATRTASVTELMESSRTRLDDLLAFGVTTAEVKSGYGLNLDDELKLLRVIRALDREGPVDLVPTLLCAHAIPSEHRANPDAYVALCANEILPAVASEKLAVAFDVFVEQSAFSAASAEKLAEAARGFGLKLKLHVDQLTRSQGAQLAAKLHALSADHLEQVDSDGIAALAKAGTSAILMPTATLFARVKPYAPGRALRDAGINVALATNINPGSSMSENLALTLGLACLENGLTPAEAYWGMTQGAAMALGLSDRGKLVPGALADIAVFRCRHYRHLPYHLGINHLSKVIKRGRLAHAAGSAIACSTE